LENIASDSKEVTTSNTKKDLCLSVTQKRTDIYDKGKGNFRAIRWLKRAEYQIESKELDKSLAYDH